MTEIDQLRSRIDEITINMMKMLKERNDVAREIGQLKKTARKDIIDESREADLHNNIYQQSSQIGLDTTIASRFLSFLLNESITVQFKDKQTHLYVYHKAKALEEQGKKIIHMEVGQPDFAPPERVQNALNQACENGHYKYGHFLGMPEFREAVSRYASDRFDAKVTQSNILASPGARFSVFSTITTLLNPGDEMIVIEPAWPAYKDCARHAGIKVKTLHTTLEERWEPDADKIVEMINPSTKMLVLNYPNNPTGKILSVRSQDELMRIVMDNGMYVLSDEIYADYSHDEWKSVLTYNYDNSIVTQSFSKSHAMTGFRIGYAVASTETISRIAKMTSLCLTNVAGPIQYAAIRALETDTSPNAKTIKDRLEIMTTKATEMNMEFVKPEGAMYLYTRPRKQEFDGTKFANRLLERGVAVAPGEGFGKYKEFIRLSACQDENILMQGMNILYRELEQI